MHAEDGFYAKAGFSVRSVGSKDGEDAEMV